MPNRYTDNGSELSLPSPVIDEFPFIFHALQKLFIKLMKEHAILFPIGWCLFFHRLGRGIESNETFPDIVTQGLE